MPSQKWFVKDGECCLLNFWQLLQDAELSKCTYELRSQLSQVFNIHHYFFTLTALFLLLRPPFPLVFFRNYQSTSKSIATLQSTMLIFNPHLKLSNWTNLCFKDWITQITLPNWFQNQNAQYNLEQSPI